MPGRGEDAGGRRAGGGDLLALGFGTTTAMWATGYVVRFPAVEAPPWLLLALLLAWLLAGGFAAGRLTRRGWRGGLAAGLLASALNLLILGSLLGGERPGTIVPSAVWWLPGSLLVGAVLGAAGGRLGAAGGDDRARDLLERQGTAAFAAVGAGATFLLVVAGGIVTSHEAGLAVVDWPNSYGYNMFLYPLARMTGGIYYEHVHRLLGSLVGLTTVVLAAHLWRVDRRRGLRWLAIAAVAAVIGQGVLGGLRVTGRFTASTSPAETEPSLALAVVHGVTGQLFLALMVALAVLSTRRWREGPPPRIRPAVGLDRGLARTLVALLVVQLVLGAVLRHVAGGLTVHITMAVFVILLAVLVSVRVWTEHEDSALLRRQANLLATLVALQLGLGIGALVATGVERAPGEPPPIDVVLTTAHQACGAALLATAVGLALWLQRLAAPGAGEPRAAAARA
jgi:cytochrome c oxidase assembly protein subunit 15